MESIFIVSGLVIVIAFIIFLVNKINLEERKKTLRYLYGKEEGFDYDARYYEHVDTYFQSKKPDRVLDDQSVKDLDLMKVYHRINRAHSSIGDEYFYARLRNQDPIEDLETFEKSIRKYEKNESLRINHQLAFQTLGKYENNRLFDFIYKPSTYKMNRMNRHRTQGVLAILALVLIPFNLNLAIPAITLIFIVNQVTFYAMKKESTEKFLVLKSYASMISTAKKIRVGGENTKLDAALDDLSKVTLYSGFLANNSSVDTSGINMMTSLLSAYFMTHILAYNAILKLSRGYSESSLIIYESIGYAEMALSVASYRKSLNTYSFPEFIESDRVSFEGLYHPLIENPVSYSKELEDKLLITGSNASGKSTFVKSLALNTILSKTINTSLAKEFKLRPYFVQTSMAISDDVESGDSYFIAEIKSIKNLLETTYKEPHSMIIIDEVLKGTNTIERIAASSAVLNYLSKTSSFVCAATHDIELTKILEKRYSNYHFRESIQEEGISFDYQIHDGPSQSKNAIKLLGLLDYPKAIVDHASQWAKDFEENNKWSSAK